MPIQNLMTFKPSLTEIRNEGDMVNVLGDLRRSLRDIVPGLPNDVKLKDIVAVVDKVRGRGYIHPMQIGEAIIQNNIDLSSVVELLSSYRARSEGGCDSCTCLTRVKPAPDETNLYCSMFETSKSISSSTGMSQRIEQYGEKGCGDRKRIFRPLAEMLGDM